MSNSVFFSAKHATQIKQKTAIDNNNINKTINWCFSFTINEKHNCGGAECNKKDLCGAPLKKNVKSRTEGSFQAWESAICRN